MDACEVVKYAAKDAGKSLRALSVDVGRHPNFWGNTVSKGSTPKADTLATALHACGYALAAGPLASVPPDALVIDAPGEDA